MSQHKYAFKFNGKTLGIRDAEQLLRLIESGKLTENDDIFLIGSKRWERISALPEYTAAKSAQASEAAIAPTDELASLINTTLGSENEPKRNLSNIDDYVFDYGKTIHKSATVTELQAQKRDTMIAARTPRPEGRVNRQAAVITAILVLLLGIAVGFFGAFEISEKAAVQGENVILQAQQNPPTPTSAGN